MANMEPSDRSMYERSDLGTARGQRLLESKGKRAPIIANVILAVLAVVLSIAAVNAVDGWADWVVLGAIVMTTIGLIIAINTRMN